MQHLGGSMLRQSQMSPALPSKYSGDLHYLYSEERRYFSKEFSAITEFEYFPYITFFQFCIRSFSVGMSVFAYGIEHVIFLISKKKMMWINAGANVAFVQDPIVVRNRPIMYLPGNPVRKVRLIIPNIGGTISRNIESTRPQPA